MNYPDFPFSTDDLKLLLLLAEEGSVKSMAINLRRDPTTVTRQLALLSQKHPVLQKHNGSWLLTPFGEEVAKLARKTMEHQQGLLGITSNIKLGTTKEFSEWVLTPLLKNLTGISRRFSLLTEVGPFEAALLNGKVDMVLSCGRPVDPTIRYKRLMKFPLVCVCPVPVRERDKLRKLLTLPAVEHTGLTLRSLLPITGKGPDIVAQFDHISGVRGAVRAGLGWSILPHYSIQQELVNKKLFEIPLEELKGMNEEFSIWYIRSYTNLENSVKDVMKAFEKAPTYTDYL